MAEKEKKITLKSVQTSIAKTDKQIEKGVDILADVAKTMYK